MAITRRQFLKRTGVVAAGGLVGPGLWRNPFVQQALAATTNKYVVILFLDGGNDGLNTVIPASNGSATLLNAYNTARGTGGGGLRITPAELASTMIANDTTGAQLGLHPGLLGLKQLYDLGKVAVVQGCGYPEYSLSHEESRVIWQTANPLGLGPYTGNGWMGRYLAANYSPTDIPAVTIADSVAAELRTYATSVLAVRRLNDFDFPYDDYYSFDNTARRDAFVALCSSASAGAQASHAYVGDSGTATLTATESYPVAHQLYTADRDPWNDAYGALTVPGNNGDPQSNGTARNLREIAKIIYAIERVPPAANVYARFFQLANGGYDTHSDQGAADPNGGSEHYRLHKEVGDAIKLFYDDLADMGVADRVLILVWSEFSRRITQNQNGTDHGSQAPMFVIGGSVNGGVYGKHPNINAGALDDDGNTVYVQGASGTAFRSTDFRDVYGTILKHWLGMTDATITSSVLPLDGGPAGSYWTAADFDMGFLP